jgi:amino acid adenylation domain-containing protein/thioester reductase-like protein
MCTVTPSEESSTEEKERLDNLCLQDLFLEQAKKTPNAIAVKDGDITLTYKELDDISDKLAIQLIEEYSVGPDVVVGILLPRSVQYVVAYVGILKAGGAYMPLELVYPKPLLERAITETNSKLVITSDAYVSRVQEQPYMLIGDSKDTFVTYETEKTYPPESYQHPNANHLAFVVMSSGTTGTPKGILQTHRSAVHSYVDRFTRYPYHTNENGDIEDNIGAGVFFVWELYRPLCQGATCVVVPDHVLFDPPAMTSFCHTEKISRLLVTPSLMQLILDTLKPEDIQKRFAPLRYLWFCGEVVSRELAMTFTKLCPHVELMNLYSISECHDVSIGDLKRELLPDRKYATCGTAIPGVTFYIVNMENQKSGLKLVENGQQGEVYVGGPVVGRGYLNMPEKSAERFVENKFPQDADALYEAPTLYKTGDMGRLLPNGHLEILGRCDFMVKIRGYSVVLGAIETALAKHLKLSSAVVLAVGEEGSREGKKLVAYVVPTLWSDPPSAASVRNFLKDHVPPYAIPGTFCVIDALPVAATAAGKLDRKKLPSPETAPRLRAFSIDDDDDDIDGCQAAASREAPANPTEQAILDIWCQLLDLSAEDLSVIDGFFDVGGHSLLATRLVALVNENLSAISSGRTLKITDVVGHPTIRGMANLLRATSTEELEKIDLLQEAEALDPSIYPDATRKGEAMSRYRAENTLLHPRVIFLTGATGYLGVHILAELLESGVTVIALARSENDEAAKERIIKNLSKYNLTFSQDIVENHLHAVSGDLSQPLLGMDYTSFKSLALEIDSIVHCGAQVNLIKPYSSLKEANVLGTQEILRLATTNGFFKTKVKAVHYISTNGIFPVEKEAYSNMEEGIIHAKEDIALDDLARNLSEGYAMTKWVAEQMCTIAESRGLPISVLRPGNMAGSTKTGIQNPDDLNYLLIKGMIETKAAPVIGTNYALDLTPVDFAAQAVSQLVVKAPHSAIGQRFHLQTPQAPVPLLSVVTWLQEMGYTIKSVDRDEWIKLISSADGQQKLASGWLSFEKYFESSTWLQFGSDNLHHALDDTPVTCPSLDASLLQRWFPLSS